MDTATRSGQKRWNAPRLILAVLSVVALMALTQCKLEPDKLTGVDKVTRGKASPGKCISDCAHKANDAMDEEKDLHKANVQACNGDPTCLANEEARHEAAVEAVQDGRKQCMEGCHHQGGGSGR